MIDFIGRRRIYAVVSLLMLTPALIGLAIWQFEAGLDFAGGLESEVRFLRDVGLPEIEDALDGAELADGVTVNASEGDEGTFVLETSLLTPDVALARESANAVIDGVVAELGSVVLVDASVEPDSARYEFWMASAATQDEVRAALETVDLGGARIQETADSAFRIRVEQPPDGDLERLRQRINGALRAEVGPIVVLQSSSVSGVLSVEIARDAGVALAVAAVAILIYISIAFRRLPNPVLYGAAAIVALLHDITLVAGAFAIGGQIAGLEVNAMFITALLAIIGYSVNDTIVVFDRIPRESAARPARGFPARRERGDHAVVGALAEYVDHSGAGVDGAAADRRGDGAAVCDRAADRHGGGHVFVDCGGVAAVGAVAGRHAAAAAADGRGATGGSVDPAQDVRRGASVISSPRASFITLIRHSSPSSVIHRHRPHPSFLRRQESRRATAIPTPATCSTALRHPLARPSGVRRANEAGRSHGFLPPQE